MPDRGTDIDYFLSISPRIAEVRDDGGSPTEFTIEDVVDTFRTKEAEASLEIMDDPFLLDATGRDDLGGGVEVGITATGNDLQIAFKARTTPLSTSAVTTGDVDGETLTDITTGTFQTDGVGRGDIVINFTDFSMGSVLSVISETVLVIDGLTGGTDNEFGIGDVVKVYDVVQCILSGGNWVANDAVGDPISSVFATFGTQIIVARASSATTQQQADLEFSSYNGGITVDNTSAFSGTIFPTGTPRQPVNNVVDAIIIANNVGLLKLFIIGNVTFTTGHDITNFVIEGQSAVKSSITVNAGAVVDGAEFEQCTLQGTLDANAMVRNSIVNDISFFEGFFIECALDGTIVLGGTIDTHIINCHDATAGGGPSIATVDMGGSGRGLIVRNFTGGLELINKTGIEEISIGIHEGRLVIDSTVTNGEVLVRVTGGEVVDNSVGATVIADSVLNPTTIGVGVWATVIESTLSALHFMRLMGAVMFGQSSGGGSSTITFRDDADTKDRITATVTVDGDRTAVVKDET